MLNRRMFLASSSAVAVAYLAPAFPVSTAPVTAVVAKPDTTIWIAGHFGDFDWHVFEGKNKIDVLREALNYHGHGNAEEIEEILTLDEEALKKELDYMHFGLDRAARMDGLLPEEIKPYHWIKSGYGACCDRCSSECYDGDGGRAFGTEAVCEECTTIIDLLGSDDDDKELAEEQLTEWFLNHDCDEASVRKQMARNFDPDLVPTEIWQKCLAEARAEL